MLTIYPTDLPDNFHQLSPENPTRVTRSRLYRLSWADIIEHSDSRFEALTEIFPGQHRPAGSFGAAGLESQEHSILWTGSPDVIARFRDDPGHVVPWAEFSERGIYVDRWPDTDAWLALIPATTWNPGGQGIVAEHDFDGAKIIVYELLGRPAMLSPGTKKYLEGLVPVVTFHWTRCHQEETHSDKYMSASPHDRRMAGLKARQHMRPGQCRGAEALAWGDNMIAAVESAVRGVPEPKDTAGLYASRCQTSQLRPDDVVANSTCAEVREARKHTARHSQGR